LDRPAQKQGKSLQRLRQIGNDYLADVAARGAVKYQPEGALPIMLADKHYCALKKGAVQLPAIQQQLALKEFLSVRHSQARSHASQAIWMKIPPCQRFVSACSGGRKRLPSDAAFSSEVR
jgi:hypothetical protein